MRYLKRVSDGFIYPFSDSLALRVGDFIEIPAEQAERELSKPFKPNPVKVGVIADTVTIDAVMDEPEPEIDPFEGVDITDEVIPEPEATEPVETDPFAEVREGYIAQAKAADKDELNAIVDALGFARPDGRKPHKERRRTILRAIRNKESF